MTSPTGPAQLPQPFDVRGSLVGYLHCWQCQDWYYIKCDAMDEFDGLAGMAVQLGWVIFVLRCVKDLETWTQ